MRHTKFFIKIISIASNIKINTIHCDSKAYGETVLLRESILRKPLELSITKDDVKNDCNEIIFAAFYNTKVIGVVHLSAKSSNNYKLRQMAISEKFQKKGVGTLLLKFILIYAKTHNIYTIYLST